MNNTLDSNLVGSVDLEIIHQRLLAPFPLEDTEVRPGVVSKDQTKATPLFYVDPRAITQRLDKVFGFGGYSILNVSLDSNLDVKINTFSSKKENEPAKPEVRKEGLLVSAICSITIHTPYLNKTVTNVGEKGLDETGHNKVTSAFAQAYKRTASLLGIGSYFYYMQLGQFPYNSYNKKVDISSLKDEAVTEALEKAGFNFTCEISGARVDWKVAAATMQYFGRVLSKEEAKKLRAKVVS